MYETALANLVKKGGDDLRGVSDPLEHIFSAVSRHIEENGMSPNMQKEHARISEAIAEGRTPSRFNEMYHQARDYGTLLREGPSSAPAAPKAAAKATSSDVLRPNITYSKNPGYNPDMIVGGAEHRVQALHPETNEVMGQMTWWGHDNPVPGEIDKIDVGEKFRRQGVATQMLEEARRTSEVDKNVPYAVHSTTRTPEGEAWAKSTGDNLPPRSAGSLDLEPTPVAPAVSSSAAADDLIEPSIVRKVEDPTREAYDAARAKGEVIVTEPYSHPTAPTSASVVAETNATKTTSLAAEYDTGSTAAKVAEGKPVSTPPPTRKGPGDLGTAAPTKKTVSPHGAKVKPSGPTIDTLSSLSAEEKLAMSGLDQGSETTTKMGARIVAETADNDMKAMQALREIGGKMNTFREGGGKVLSRDAGKALSEAVTQGIKGSKNLRLAALGTAVGLGAYGVSRFQHRRTNSDLQS